MMEASVGFALCGSYCCFDKAIAALRTVEKCYGDVVPIMSENASGKDTRFGRAEDFKKQISTICRRPIIDTIQAAEPFGPQHMADVLVIAPCTGNTLAKIAHGITDTAVTMAAKSHLRNGRPVVIAFSTNDGLAASMRNIGELLLRKNIYIVPFSQDDPKNKPTSLASDFSLIPKAIEAALRGEQLQPIVV